MNSKKVLITGISLITSLGINKEDTWNGFIRGESGVGRIKKFDPSNHITQIASEIPPNIENIIKCHLSPRLIKQTSRATQLVLIAASALIKDGNLDFDSINRKRCAVVIGHGGSSFQNNSGENDEYLILKDMPNSLPAWISIKYKIEGPSYTISTACASGAYAIGSAYDLIAYDKADIVICGGADSMITPHIISGFNSLMALSERNSSPEKASRPFEKGRDGFVIGEGVGLLILESEEHAKRRKARAYSCLNGYATTSETSNIMAPKKNGVGMADTMRLALKNTCLKPEEIDYINPHGTSTRHNDLFETKAIKEVFGKQAYSIPVSSQKSMIGHTIGAAGAIELITTALIICNNIIPPTINYEMPDPGCDLDYVPNIARKKIVKTALSNSFAFGGHNCTLVISKYNN